MEVFKTATLNAIFREKLSIHGKTFLIRCQYLDLKPDVLIEMGLVRVITQGHIERVDFGGHTHKKDFLLTEFLKA